MVKIKRIFIKNYRSIVEADIETADMNIFVGLNDVGKSNVLKALNLFFNYKADTFDFFEDYSSLVHLKGHRAKEIVIRLTLEIPEGYADKGDVEWTKKWGWTQTKGVSYSSTYNREFSAKSRTQVLLDRISYEYIPAVKSKAYFRELLAKMYESMLTAANSELKDVNQGYSDKLQKLTLDLSGSLKKNLSIDSYIKMPENLSTLFRDLFFETKDGEGNPINLLSRGDGIQARHIPSILKFIYDRKSVDAVKRSVPCTVIWGYEEPENGIELAACFQLAEEFKRYSKNIQFFATSHSPAFYSLQKEETALVYLTYKEDNKTQYACSDDMETLNRHFGLMPIIQPYVDKELKKYREQETIIEELKLKIQKESKRKIIIITEGESDVIHINTAFQQLQGLDSGLIKRLRFFNFEEKKTLGDELKTILSYYSCTPTENIIIGIFDRDKPVQCSKGKNYAFIKGTVYQFNIPAITTAERSENDKITIENYYTNAEIKTCTPHGRLYMKDDFDKYGTSTDRDWSIHKFSKNESLTAVSIIDANYKHLERKSDNAKMATKIEFANYVKDNPASFDFSNFKKIYDIIKEIVSTHEKK